MRTNAFCAPRVKKIAKVQSRKAVANQINLTDGPAHLRRHPVRPTVGINLAEGPPISCSSATTGQVRPDVGSSNWRLTAQARPSVHTKDRHLRWRGLFEVQAARLLAELEDTPQGPLWTQDLYGAKDRFLGPVHGFAGNVIPLLLG
jgi:hypothetical protein